jgi:serine protease Do
MKKFILIASVAFAGLVLFGLMIVSVAGAFLSPASATAGLPALANTNPTLAVATDVPAAQPPKNVSSPSQVQPQTTVPNSFLASYEGTLETIYSQVSPSVVSIHVVSQTTASASPFGRRGGSGGTTVSEALGSGFVWDMNGDIVTNNHVVDGATTIDVTFSDGENFPATVVGTDVFSDLAVIKVKVDSSLLHPVSMGDSSQVKVGQLAIAIGNPFGLQNTMTVGVISGLGRTLPAGSNGSSTTGPSYTIPEIIQTDAPINPGNSGGVLLDDQSNVLGVTAAIASNTDSSAGIGFVIPSSIVSRVVPSLIQTGSYQHPYLGISGTSLDASINNAMSLPANQQGALVETVTAGGPADKAGLKGSNNNLTINGQTAAVGGDVIIAFNGQKVKSMDDLIAQLEEGGTIGQKVTLTILRNGKQMTIDLTPGARPSQVGLTLPGGDPNAELVSLPLSQGKWSIE